MDVSTYLEFLRIGLVCLLWYLCSASDNIIGKVVLSDFPYPMTMTMIQLSTTSFILAPFLPCLGANKKGSYEQRYLFRMIIPLAIGKFISSVSSYISIWKVSVSYAHTVKATLPMFTVILAKLILGENQTLPVYLSLFPIIFGVGVATVTEATYDSVGLSSAMTATICFSLLTIFTKKCLKDTGYHHLQLLVLVSRIATVCFLPIWILADLPRIFANSEFLQSGKLLQTAMLLICEGILNMMHSVFAFTVLALVSPLSYAVANASKRIVIIGGSILILQNTVSALNAVGMMIAVFGVLCYNKAKYDQMQAARREKVLPFVHSDSNLLSAGVHHMPHSKSDAKLLQVENHGFLQDKATDGLSTGSLLELPQTNGHILLRDWHGSSNGTTLIPVRGSSGYDRMSSSPVSGPHVAHESFSSATLHSRSIYNV